MISTRRVSQTNINIVEVAEMNEGGSATYAKFDFEMHNNNTFSRRGFSVMVLDEIYDIIIERIRVMFVFLFL